MRGKDASYNEPLKRQARADVLRHAVVALTTGRATSPLVTGEEFDRLLEYCVDFIRKHARQDLSEAVAPLREDWHAMHASRVGKRAPADLKVLFLSGPEPLNDFVALAELGVNPHNVWAVESDKNTFLSAVTQLREVGAPLKLHWGNLREFFAVVPEQFDIVYFDACGPLFGGEPRTNLVLQELFLRQRMAALSALITNFAATPRDNEEKWINRMLAWYVPRFFQPVYHASEEIDRVNGENTYLEHLKEHLEEYYSDFVSRFTIEVANQLLAWWRVRALRAASRAYLAQESQLKAAIAASLRTPERGGMQELLRSVGHAQLAPSSYPYLWTINLAREHLESNDPLLDLLLKETLEQTKLSDAIEAVSLVRNFFEGYVDWGAHNWQACSDDLRDLLDAFRWFDSEGQPLDRFFCDVPLPNLIVDLLVGLYGYPYHVNLRKLRRISYCAKQTTMMSDVFVLDQCRYLYDLVPTLPLFGPELPHGVQFILRICMDLIRRHTDRSCWDLYRGAALAAAGEAGFAIHRWPERVDLR